MAAEAEEIATKEEVGKALMSPLVQEVQIDARQAALMDTEVRVETENRTEQSKHMLIESNNGPSMPSAAPISMG